MKLSQLKTGYIVTKSSKRDEYEYAPTSSTYTMGICSNGVLVSAGETKIYVHGVAKKGQGLRSRVDGDGGKAGQAVLVPNGYSAAYLNIGTALETGRDKLISVSLDIRYVKVSGGSFAGDMDDIADGSTYVKTQNNYTNTDKSKLGGIAAGAEVNVNADWNAVSGDAQILNKPLVVGAEEFETVSKNIKSYPYVITYNGDDIDYITYNLGGALRIVKKFNYTLGVLTSIVLSGDTPLGIELTKTFSYTGDDLTGVVYS